MCPIQKIGIHFSIDKLKEIVQNKIVKQLRVRDGIYNFGHVYYLIMVPFKKIGTNFSVRTK